MEKDERPAPKDRLPIPISVPGLTGIHPAANPSLDSNAALVKQILASRTFAKSVRLSKFLEFICQKTLEGKAYEINEQQIGIHVFGRSQNYNAADDSIVRTQARLLRQRLEEYFDHECPACTTVVLIPKGGYVPVFERRANNDFRLEARENSASRGGFTDSIARVPLNVPAPRQSDNVAVLQPHAEATGKKQSDQQIAPSWDLRHLPPKRLLLLIVVALGILATGSTLPYLARLLRASTNTPTLWSSVFGSRRPVVIVPSDDGLVLSEEFRHAPVTLDEYLSGSYVVESGPRNDDQTRDPAARPLTPAWLNAHQYTSTADLGLAMRLNRLPEASVAAVETRYARVLRLDDLKSQNVILIGGIGANPWVGLFSHQLNFDVNYDWKTAQGYVINKDPRKGELPKYLDTYGDGLTTSYGVLAYLPGINGEGCALLFQGSGMAGTEAAADFPFNKQSFTHFLEQIGYSSHGPVPFFEVLMETKSVGGNAPQSQILAWRVISR